MNSRVSIGSVVDVNPPIPQTLKNEPNTLVSFLSMSAISETGKILAPEESKIGAVIKGYRYFERGDVLLAKITPCMENGKAVFVDRIPHQVGFGSTEFHVLRPSSKIYGRYLFYMIWNPMFRYVAERNMTGTAGQRRVPTDFVRRFKIPLPPLEEQKRIAAILDKADAIRRKRKEAIALTEELLRSTFLDMFGDPVTNQKGWKAMPLGKIATFLGGGTPSRKQPHFYEGNICWASSKDMNVDVLVDTEEHITQEAIDNSSTKLIDAGMLLIVVKSKILMRRLPVARTKVPTCFNQDIKAIIPHDLSITRYLHRHLKLGQETLLRQARGVNTEGLTLDHLRNYKVMTPPTQEIHKFIGLEKSLERSLSTNQKADKEDRNLFNSLLQKAFRGEL